MCETQTAFGFCIGDAFFGLAGAPKLAPKAFRQANMTALTEATALGLG